MKELIEATGAKTVKEGSLWDFNERAYDVFVRMHGVF